ncbi:MAG: SDR family oxidoreductase [Phototrophicaceae bacterium]
MTNIIRDDEMTSQKVLVTGATGYVGGRLIPRLIDEGYDVRVLVRDASRLTGRDWLEDVEVFEGDVLKAETLPSALDGVWATYYLIHSMSDHDDFHERDVKAAKNFATAAHDKNVERIIYLGGLGDADADLSEHLRSRQLTGQALSECGVPVTEFRASILVGSGSVSFELVRSLTERLPIMISPKWVYTRTQPIAIRDALSYLIDALSTPDSAGKIIEIGGKDVQTYHSMIMTYADVRELKRFIIPVPVLSPYLSSHWVQLVTPIPNKIARPLIEGLRNEATADTQLAEELFPQIKPISYKEAVVKALGKLDASEVETAWTDSLGSSQGDKEIVTFTEEEGMFIEKRETVVDASPQAVYKAFTGIGGERGWMTFDWAWQLRAWMDIMVGGVGFRRGRRDPDTLYSGEALDFWRVEAIEGDKLLRLRAEMKVPGKAWLEFQTCTNDDNETVLMQTAYFAPKGLFGLLYWYTLVPLHGPIFSGMINKLKETAENWSQQEQIMEQVENSA